jgi:hypothetical protein
MEFSANQTNENFYFIITYEIRDGFCAEDFVLILIFHISFIRKIEDYLNTNSKLSWKNFVS